MEKTEETNGIIEHNRYIQNKTTCAAGIAELLCTASSHDRLLDGRQRTRKRVRA
jgi:hypothetical protein